jgi:AcrR family transcriptional regulator
MSKAWLALVLTSAFMCGCYRFTVVSGRPASPEPQRSYNEHLDSAIVGDVVTARVVSRQPLDAATTNEIADLAGVSIGSLYQYFPSKHALVASLVRSRAATDVAHLTTFVDLPPEVPLVEAMNQAVRALVDLHRRSPHLYQVLLRAVPDLGQHDAVREIARMGRDRFAKFLRDHRHQTRSLDADLAALVLGRSIEAVLHCVILERPELLDDPRLIDELTTLAVRYVERRDE